MTRKPRPVEIDDERLGEVTGGEAQRSKVTSVTVTFSTTVSLNSGDPDKPIIVGNVPNTE